MSEALQRARFESSRYFVDARYQVSALSAHLLDGHLLLLGERVHFFVRADHLIELAQLIFQSLHLEAQLIVLLA